MPHIVIKLKDGAINVTFSIVDKWGLSAGCITEKKYSVNLALNIEYFWQGILTVGKDIRGINDS